MPLIPPTDTPSPDAVLFGGAIALFVALIIAVALVAVGALYLAVALVARHARSAGEPDVASGAAAELACDITYCPACGLDVSPDMPQPYGEPVFCERHERVIFEQIS